MVSKAVEKDIDAALHECREEHSGLGHLFQCKMLLAINVEVIDYDGAHHSMTYGDADHTHRFLLNPMWALKAWVRWWWKKRTRMTRLSQTKRPQR